MHSACVRPGPVCTHVAARMCAQERALRLEVLLKPVGVDAVRSALVSLCVAGVSLVVVR